MDIRGEHSLSSLYSSFGALRPGWRWLGLRSRLYGGDLRAQLLPIALVSVIPPEAIGIRQQHTQALRSRMTVASSFWAHLPRNCPMASMSRKTLQSCVATNSARRDLPNSWS